MGDEGVGNIRVRKGGAGGEGLEGAPCTVSVARLEGGVEFGFEGGGIKG